MHITGLIVSVDYADFLERGLALWRDGLDELLVITTHRDAATGELCSRCQVPHFCSTAFQQDGSVFNKAAAVCDAIERAVTWRDWLLFLDADVVPPADWRQRVERAAPVPGNLYGARRSNEGGSLIRDGEIPSYFQLWHTSDANVQCKPLLDTAWRHAGGYDSEFQSRWKPTQRIWLPLTLKHYGPRGLNWWGRGNITAHEEMVRQRGLKGGIAPCERTDGRTQGLFGR